MIDVVIVVEDVFVLVAVSRSKRSRSNRCSILFLGEVVVDVVVVVEVVVVVVVVAVVVVVVVVVEFVILL